jgi:hypothetical protein
MLDRDCEVISLKNEAMLLDKLAYDLKTGLSSLST